MLRFLKENWIWICAPVVLVIVALLIISMTNTGEPPPGFEYDL